MFFAGLNSVIADSPGFEGFSQELIWPAALGGRPQAKLAVGCQVGQCSTKGALAPRTMPSDLSLTAHHHHCRHRLAEVTRTFE